MWPRGALILINSHISILYPYHYLPAVGKIVVNYNEKTSQQIQLMTPDLTTMTAFLCHVKKN